MSNGELTDHIKNSITYHSLLLEKKVRTAFEALGWDTSPNAYYSDADSEQDREFDLFALRSWNRTRRGVQHTVRLSVLAECKAIRNGDVIVMPDRSGGAVDRTYFYWLGLDDESLRAGLVAIMAREGMKPRQIDGALDRFIKAVEPHHRSDIVSLTANAHRAPLRGTAASEVRGQDKSDAHNFVWNATRQVFSALRSVTLELRADDLEELAFAIVASGGKPEVAASDTLIQRSELVQLFHPVVVTTARLWKLTKGDGLEPIEWCRIDQARIANSDRRWIDLVSADAVDSYVAEMSAWYSRVFGKLRAEETTKRAG